MGLENGGASVVGAVTRIHPSHGHFLGYSYKTGAAIRPSTDLLASLGPTYGLVVSTLPQLIYSIFVAR